MSAPTDSEIVAKARDYYNSDSADDFYFRIWGGEDIHIGIYQNDDEPIASASQRTVSTMAGILPGMHPGTRILDIGSGYGGSARFLAQSFGCRVDCLNLSEIQNERNRQANTQQNLADKIRVFDGSFESLPFSRDSYDVVWSQDAILHSGDKEKVFHEVDRVLSPSGLFIFTDPMQSDDCPPGVLQPVYDRIHLTSMGSFAFYRSLSSKLGWSEFCAKPMTGQLVKHYSTVLENLQNRYDQLSSTCGTDYLDKMKIGLRHWIDAGEKNYLAWGILAFQKKSITPRLI